MIDIISKEQFLIEHNKLSPVHLRAAFALLTLFQEQKKPLLQDAHWSHKLRIPFILWLTILPKQKEKRARKPTKQVYRNYPETH